MQQSSMGIHKSGMGMQQSGMGMQQAGLQQRQPQMAGSQMDVSQRGKQQMLQQSTGHVLKLLEQQNKMQQTGGLQRLPPQNTDYQGMVQSNDEQQEVVLSLNQQNSAHMNVMSNTESAQMSMGPQSGRPRQMVSQNMRPQHPSPQTRGQGPQAQQKIRPTMAQQMLQRSIRPHGMQQNVRLQGMQHNVQRQGMQPNQSIPEEALPESNATKYTTAKAFIKIYDRKVFQNI